MQAQISAPSPIFRRQTEPHPPALGSLAAKLHERSGAMATAWFARHRAAQAHQRTVAAMAGLSEQMLKDAAVSEELRADVRSYQALLGARNLRDLGAMTRR